MNELEYFKECANHDWDYYFSDDNRVFQKGEYKQNQLFNLSKTNPKLDIIYKLWYNWHTARVTGKILPKPTIEDINVN